MKKRMIVASTAAALLVSTSGLALAASAQRVGEILEINPESAGLTMDEGTNTAAFALDDGNTYILPPWTNAEALEVGDTVRVVYDSDMDASGLFYATWVETVSAEAAQTIEPLPQPAGEPETVAGQIQAIDSDAKTVRLDDGSEFKLPGATNLASFNEGMQVQIEYDEIDGERFVRTIVPQL